MLNLLATTSSAAVVDPPPPRKGGSLPHLRRLLPITVCIIIIASSITAASFASYGGASGCASLADSTGSGSSSGETGRLLQLLPRFVGGGGGSPAALDADAPTVAAAAATDGDDDDGQLWRDDGERFLIIAGVTEQLGKAIYHMEDLFELCILSNRTCVLPGVAGGQFALDGPLNFGDVFDTRSIPAAVRVVEWGRFARHFRRRFGGQSSSSLPRVTMCAVGKETVSNRMVTTFQRTAQYYQPSVAFAMEPTCETTIIGFPADRQQQADNFAAVMSVLGESGKSEAQQHPHHHHAIVAVFHYDWSEPFPRPTRLTSAGYAGLDFNARFYAQATAFRDQVGDYIHLQWRMEKADGGKGTNYTACALAAIRHIRQLSQSAGVNQVYFSSDVGRDGVPWSNSYGVAVPKDALNALDLIYGEFPGLLTWINVTSPMLPRFDMATVGVMDRLIAMGSTYFVRGPKECSRVGAYVQSIGKWRKNRLAEMRAAADGDQADGDDEREFGSRIMNEADEFLL